MLLQKYLLELYCRNCNRNTIKNNYFNDFHQSALTIYAEITSNIALPFKRLQSKSYCGKTFYLLPCTHLQNNWSRNPKIRNFCEQCRNFAFALISIENTTYLVSQENYKRKFLMNLNKESELPLVPHKAEEIY